jgi:hypothetical protein
MQEIMDELYSRGEKFIRCEDGIVISSHGKSTINYWQPTNGELVCIDTQSIILDLTYKKSDGRQTYNHKSTR